MTGNLSTFLSVLLPLITVLIALIVAIDHFVYKKKSKELPNGLQKVFKSFVTFGCFFFAYCLLELVLCSLVEIKSRAGGLGWVTLLLVTVPFVYAATYFWKFSDRFGEPKANEPGLDPNDAESNDLEAKYEKPSREISSPIKLSDVHE